MRVAEWHGGWRGLMRRRGERIQRRSKAEKRERMAEGERRWWWLCVGLLSEHRGLTVVVEDEDNLARKSGNAGIRLRIWWRIRLGEVDASAVVFPGPFSELNGKGIMWAWLWVMFIGPEEENGVPSN
ncbi:hypothetical protein Droror1_Dr00023303 [Drosera rotundifolia]